MLLATSPAPRGNEICRTFALRGATLLSGTRCGSGSPCCSTTSRKTSLGSGPAGHRQAAEERNVADAALQRATCRDLTIAVYGSASRARAVTSLLTPFPPSDRFTPTCADRMTRSPGLSRPSAAGRRLSGPRRVRGGRGRTACSSPPKAPRSRCSEQVLSNRTRTSLMSGEHGRTSI